MYRKSLVYSIWDGVFWSVMVGFGETYFIPYAITLGASNFMVGLLVSLPLLAGSLGQLATPQLLKLFSNRKNLVKTGVLLQAACYLPIIGASFLNTAKVPVLLLLIIIYTCAGLAVSPTWQSWMGDLVATENRGRYFSDRNRWIQISTFTSVALAGWLLHLYGFIIIFVIAVAGRMISFYFLGRQAEPQHHNPPEAQFTFLQFVKKMRFNNYGLFVIYNGLVLMSVHISGPYFTPYQLNELHFTYIQFMISQAAFVGTKALFLPLWGHYSDRYGSRKLMSLSGYLLPLLPLIWIFCNSLGAVVFVQCVAGFIWAGFELTTFNFILDCTTPEKRARCAAYYQVFGGIGTVGGALIGGLLLLHPLLFPNPFLFVFLVSGLLRLYVVAILTPKIREMRVVEAVSYRTLLLRMVLFLKPGPS